MTYHDKSYKRFFSDPVMVRDLLTGFIHEDWVEDLDFSTLETVKNQFVTDDLRQREDDIIWRIHSRQGWVYGAGAGAGAGAGSCINSNADC